MAAVSKNSRKRRARNRQIARRTGELSPQEQATVLAASYSASSFSGPLPDPGTLEKYDQLVPGAAQLLFDLFAEQSRHRHVLENRVTISDGKRSWVGLLSANLVAFAHLAAGAGLVYAGHDEAGGAIATVSVVGLVTAFIYGTNARKKERIEKAKLMTGKK